MEERPSDQVTNHIGHTNLQSSPCMKDVSLDQSGCQWTQVREDAGPAVAMKIGTGERLPAVRAAGRRSAHQRCLPDYPLEVDLWRGLPRGCKLAGLSDISISSVDEPYSDFPFVRSACAN